MIEARASDFFDLDLRGEAAHTLHWLCRDAILHLLEILDEPATDEAIVRTDQLIASCLRNGADPNIHLECHWPGRYGRCNGQSIWQMYLGIILNVWSDAATPTESLSVLLRIAVVFLRCGADPYAQVSCKVRYNFDAESPRTGPLGSRYGSDGWIKCGVSALCVIDSHSAQAGIDTSPVIGMLKSVGASKRARVIALENYSIYRSSYKLYNIDDDDRKALEQCVLRCIGSPRPYHRHDAQMGDADLRLIKEVMTRNAAKLVQEPFKEPVKEHLEPGRTQSCPPFRGPAALSEPLQRRNSLMSFDQAILREIGNCKMNHHKAEEASLERLLAHGEEPRGRPVTSVIPRYL